MVICLVMSNIVIISLGQWIYSIKNTSILNNTDKTRIKAQQRGESWLTRENLHEIKLRLLIQNKQKMKRQKIRHK